LNPICKKKKNQTTLKGLRLLLSKHRKSRNGDLSKNLQLRNKVLSNFYKTLEKELKRENFYSFLLIS